MEHKTLFSGINDRIAIDRNDGDIAFFSALMYKLEFLVKIIISGVVACLEDDHNRYRYTLEHKLIRADSIGLWNEAFNEALIGPSADSMPDSARNMAKDFTQRVGQGDWRYKALVQLATASQLLGANVELGSKEPLRRFVDIAARIRNRSRGHGAPTATQCAASCPYLLGALRAIETNCVILCLPWVYLHQNLSRKYRITPLLNDPSPFEYLKTTTEVRLLDGVYIHLNYPSALPSSPIHVHLIFTNADFLDVWLPNGNHRKGTFEVFSYLTNDARQEDASHWLAPPQVLPGSETKGTGSLEFIGNILTNSPPTPARYVARTELESRLTKLLINVHRHSIVTLTGRGGIGKTTLALKAVTDMFHLSTPPYSVVLWISARDIDLLDTGPKPVSQRVFTQKDVARAAVELIEPPDWQSTKFNHERFFEDCLKHGAFEEPTLFVLDNFETLNSPEDVYEWVDTHIRPPNKILITTRFRDFRGDYPLDVPGMSDDESLALIEEHAKWLGIHDLLTQEYRTSLIEESEGHPYVIRILLGQAE